MIFFSKPHWKAKRNSLQRQSYSVLLTALWKVDIGQISGRLGVIIAKGQEAGGAARHLGPGDGGEQTGAAQMVGVYPIDVVLLALFRHSTVAI